MEVDGKIKQTFVQAKELLSSATVLVHHDPRLSLWLAAYASAYGVWAEISRLTWWHWATYILSMLRNIWQAVRRTMHKKETLALIFGVCKLHTFLYEKWLILYTDHKPLTTILGPKKTVLPLAAAPLQCWALPLVSYMCTTTRVSSNLLEAVQMVMAYWDYFCLLLVRINTSPMWMFLTSGR